MRGMHALINVMKKNKTITQIDLDDRPRIRIVSIGFTNTPLPFVESNFYGKAIFLCPIYESAPPPQKKLRKGCAENDNFCIFII